MKKELVIARYNRSVSWIQDLNTDVKVSIYNKNKETLQPNEIFITPNMGRCIHTFFYHIVHRYDTLADLTFFSQDHPFDHIKNYVDVINNEKLLENYVYKSGDGFFIDNTEFKKLLICNRTGIPENPGLNIKKTWESIFENKNVPTSFSFVAAGHYTVTKEKIYQKDVTFYKKILNYLEYDSISHFHYPWGWSFSDYPKPYEIERLLIYIYDKNIL